MMGVKNAWNPLLVAIVATIATAFQIIAGFVDCDFIRVEARDNEVLAIIETSEQTITNETNVGLLCDGDFYDLEDDKMRMYSQVFYYVSTGFGCLGMLGAWAISTCLTPTLLAWRIIPVLSSISAMASLPVFLILETYPCDDFEEQSCSLSYDSYYWIAAAALQIVVTALTQFLDPPEWVSQLHHWRLPKVRSMETNQWSSEEDEEGSQDPILTPRLQPPKSMSDWWEGRRRRSSERKEQRVEREAPRQNYSYALPTQDMEQADSLVEEEVVTQESTEQQENAESWIHFVPSDNSFREKEPIRLVDGRGHRTQSAPTRLVATATRSSRENQQSSASLAPPSLAPSLLEEPERLLYKIQPLRPIDPPMTPPIPHYRSEQNVTISPLTHQTESAPGSPSIERTNVQDPILRHSRASTPSRNDQDRIEAANAFLNETTQMSTPVRHLAWSREESVLDGICNGDESILDKKAGIPFIPTAEESKRIATLGYSVYADLDRQDSSTASKSTDPPLYDIDELVDRSVANSSNHPQYNIDELVDRSVANSSNPPQYNIDELVDRSVADSSNPQQKADTSIGSISLLGSEDVRAIALEGTPIYASLLMEQGTQVKRQSFHQGREDNKPASTRKETTKKSLSTGAYMVHQPASKEEKRAKQQSDDMNKGGKANWNLTTLRRSNSGYDKLDDISLSDEEGEPPMTEVSFDPNEIQEASLDKDERTPTKHQSEQVLLDEWNKMFDAHGPIPVKMKEAPEEDEDEEDRKDEAELLRLISSEDFSDESPKETGGEGGKEARSDSASSSSSSPDKPPRSGGKTSLRPKRKARRSRSRASGSVGSSPSLLDVTIEEETPSDLEEFNNEEKKNPKRTTLASYAAESGNKSRIVPSSLNMTGMHSYHTVEHHGSDELEAITAGVQEALRRARGRSASTDVQGKVYSVRSLSPSTTRVSTWRAERENRASIHDPVVVSSSSDEDDQGVDANNLRQSRIQRLQQRIHQQTSISPQNRTTLQQLSTTEITALVRAKVRRDKYFGDYKSRYDSPSKTSDESLSQQSQDPPAHLVTSPSKKSPAPVSPGFAGDDGSNTTTPDDVGEVGSFLLGALNLELHDLDASLAALSRPDDSEIGPDERSI